MPEFIREFPIVTRTDRDCEMPCLVEYVQGKKKIKSFLDIGAHYTWYYYASKIREYIGQYDGIDILDDPKGRDIMDNYYVGNANTFELKPHDVVACVSTIEHAGVSTYKGDCKKEQMDLFKRCLELAKKSLWISFPVGAGYYFENEFSTIVRDQLDEWERLVKPYKVNQRFFYSEGPQASKPWREHKDRDFALSVPYIVEIGNQSICLLEVEK